MRKRFYFSAVLQFVLGTILTAQSSVVFQTTTPPSAGTATGGTISSTHWVGTYFVLSAPVHVDTIGLAASGDAVVGDIYNVPDLSSFLHSGTNIPAATAQIQPSSTNSVATGLAGDPKSGLPRGVDLAAGTYLLMFRSSGSANLALSDGASLAAPGVNEVEYGLFCDNGKTMCWTTTGMPAPFYFVIKGSPAEIPPYRITSLSPAMALPGGDGFTLTVNGAGFAPGPVVIWSGTQLTTTFVSDTQLTAAVPANLISIAGKAEVHVVSQGTMVTNLLWFAIGPPGPSILSTGPTSLTLGSHQFTLTVNGTGFPSDSKVVWNGSTLQTTLVNAFQLAAVVPASLVTPGTVDLYVTSGTGTSPHYQQLSVQAPTPVLTSLNPNLVSAGAAFTLTLNGSGFVNGATLNWNGTTQVPTTFVSDTELKANISASLTQVAGIYNVSVQNPGSTASTTISLVVEAPGSAISSPALAHYAVGSNFITGITVVNTGGTSAAYSISFFDDKGAPALVPFATGTSNYLSGNLPPYGSVYVEAGNPTLALSSGWAQVRAESSIVVQELFRSTLNNTHYEAAVPQSTGSKAFELPFDATLFAADTPLYTGIAIANLDGQNAAAVTCTARDGSGVVIPNGVVIPSIAALGHWAGNEFPALAGRRGTLDCVSTTSVAVLGLRFIGTDTFSSLPVIRK